MPERFGKSDELYHKCKNYLLPRQKLFQFFLTNY